MREQRAAERLVEEQSDGQADDGAGRAGFPAAHSTTCAGRGGARAAHRARASTRVMSSMRHHSPPLQPSTASMTCDEQLGAASVVVPRQDLEEARVAELLCPSAFGASTTPSGDAVQGRAGADAESRRPSP